MEKKISYRVRNYYTKEPRTRFTECIDNDLLDMIKEVARYQRKSIAWIVETALSDYFDFRVKLRKVKNQRPEFSQIVKTRKRA
jgi:hypothetical protein